MVAIGTVAFLAVGLWTNLKRQRKEAAAATGGTLDAMIQEDDSSIWSADDGIGDMAGPAVSAVAAMGANSRVAIQLGADASVVSALTTEE